MEKLQPLITHRFWVLFGLAILVPFVAWFMYNGSIQETIAGRKSTIKGDFTKAKAGGDTPNKEAAEGASSFNEHHESEYSKAASQLWLAQQNDTSMFWPRRMEGFINPPGGTPLKFGESPADTNKSLQGKTIYQADYDEQFQQKVMSQIRRYPDKGGLCEVNEAMIHRVPSEMMRSALPDWETIWHAQEDVWLVAQLLKSIDNVNTSAGSRSITESPVRQVHELTLYGGNLDNPKKAGKKGRSGGGYASKSKGRGLSLPGGSGSGLAGLGSEGMSGGLGSNNTKSGGVTSPDVDFNVEEEFGSPIDTSKKKKGKKKRGIDGGGYAQQSSQNPFAASGDLRRYVHDKEGGKFKTRGFKAKLTIQQDKLPALLAELTNSRWPVEIVRVHWEAANENGRQAASVSGIGGLGGSSGGLGGLGGGLGGSGNPYGGGNGRSLSGPGGAGFGGLGADGMPPSGGSGLGGSTTGQPPEKDKKDPLSAALQDPNLATVVVAGLITIFQVSEEEAARIQETLKQETAADIVPGGMPADGAVAGEPAEGSEEQPPTEQPADGTTESSDAAAEPQPGGEGDSATTGSAQ